MPRLEGPGGEKIFLARVFYSIIYRKLFDFSYIPE
jgi:hypothetical protein